MNYLDLLRQRDAKKENRGEGVPTKPTKPGFDGFVGGGPPPVGNCEAPPLTPEQLVAREEVLARLEANPAIKRAFVSRWDGDVMIVTLAVRAVGTCELSIPRERLSSLEDYPDLAACIPNAEGSA